MYVKARWDAKSVRCSEFRGGRFSDVANVLHKRDFQSVTATLSAVGSVSAQGGFTVVGKSNRQMDKSVSVLVHGRHVRIGYWIGKLTERK